MEYAAQYILNTSMEWVFKPITKKFLQFVSDCFPYTIHIIINKNNQVSNPGSKRIGYRRIIAKLRILKMKTDTNTNTDTNIVPKAMVSAPILALPARFHQIIYNRSRCF
jgi:hypothetical protein